MNDLNIHETTIEVDPNWERALDFESPLFEWMVKVSLVAHWKQTGLEFARILPEQLGNAIADWLNTISEVDVRLLAAKPIVPGQTKPQPLSKIDWKKHIHAQQKRKTIIYWQLLSRPKPPDFTPNVEPVTPRTERYLLTLDHNGVIVDG